MVLAELSGWEQGAGADGFVSLDGEAARRKLDA